MLLHPFRAPVVAIRGRRTTHTSRPRWCAAFLLSVVLLSACTNRPQRPQPQPPITTTPAAHDKPIIYQMMTRSFGNQQTRNKPWGTIAENGVGKFSGINNAALTELRQMGISHIWYTGVLHHAVVADYSKYGISPDDPEVVKGRAGSPYAIKDYYNVNPDLADDPARRLAEFKALIQRTHAHGMKVIIDIVPNHVARHYQSTNLPADEMNLGANDNIYVEYARDNNFYYIPDQPFTLPKWPSDYKVLGGESHPMIDGSFAELPAKWTGNGSRQAQPTFDDWYETVKLNFGVRPDGTADFTRLPANYENLDNAAHWQFWQQQQVPDTWQKFRAISEFWLAQGVDGFRYDMAEMVPVEFWSYLNSHIKQQRPDALLIAEVYNPLEYRNYLKLGRMDTLYDKVDFYDTLKAIMQNKSPTSELLSKQAQVSDIESSMLHFLENHDEQRIASPEFVGDAHHGKPAMLVSTTISSSPILLYFGQEVGETGALDCGFGKPSRTTIFDYCGVPAHQRWMNDGAFDGGALSAEARSLRDFYSRLLRFSAGASALRGAYQPLNTTPGYSEPGSATIAFARWSGDQQLLVLAELQKRNITPLVLTLPAELISAWGLADGPHILKEQLYGQRDLQLEVSAGIGRIHTELQALDAMIFAVQRQ